jgi:hypothetical protein
MALNLIKLAVGIEDLEHLDKRQRQWRDKKTGHYRHWTRMTPKRDKELLDGGSLYWVIKGMILVRQPIVGFSEDEDEGKPMCVIELAPVQIPVQPRAQRAFQGWRYLKADAAPADIKKGGKLFVDPNMPQKMKLELAKLGLL